MAIGSVGGPIGMLAGGIIGSFFSMFSNDNSKMEEKQREAEIKKM